MIQNAVACALTVENQKSSKFYPPVLAATKKVTYNSLASSG